MLKMKSIWNGGVIFVLLVIIINTFTSAVGHDCLPKGGTDAQDAPGPIIIPCQDEIILEKGQNFTLRCKGKAQVQFKHQKIGEEGYGTTFTKIPRYMPSSDPEYMYETALDLNNVDQYAVGYYACFDSTINGSEILNDITEEPNNTDHVTYIYIYVNGTENLLVPMGEIVQTRSKAKVVLGCRPTTPDVKISLRARSYKTADIKFSPKVGFLVKACNPPFTCHAVLGNRNNYISLRCPIMPAPEPKIDKNIGSKYFLEGETFSLNCTVDYQLNHPVELIWDIPRKIGKELVKNDTNECEVTNGVLYKNITIVNATKDDAGTYTCYSSNMSHKKAQDTYVKEYIEEPFIFIKKRTPENHGLCEISNAMSLMILKTEIDGYPEPKFYFLRDDQPLPANASKYQITRALSGDILLKIFHLDVQDTANYTLVCDNGYVKKNITYDVRVKSKPTVKMGSKHDIKGLIDGTVTVLCDVTSYPLPNIIWEFSVDEKEHQLNNPEYSIESPYRAISRVDIPVKFSGNVTCTAENSIGNDKAYRQLLVYEIKDGFGIKDSPTWYPENEDVILQCLASKYDYENLTWVDLSRDEDLTEIVQYSESPFSHVAMLKIDNIPISRAGDYTCVGFRKNGEERRQTISIVVEGIREPIINEPKIDEDEEVAYYQPVHFYCEADGVPPPVIEWFKDGIPLENNTDGILIINYLDHTILNSTVSIAQMKDENKGKYECVATNKHDSDRKFINLAIKEKSPYTATYIGIIGVVFFALMILIIYLTWKVKREKRFRKELAAAGLLYFKEGVTKSLNPDLVVDEQAELLPYDERFEFPPEKLFLGKQLGAGAFGVVYKAEARGIINAEETTTVAVKMVKKTADNMYIKALASELKIMVHLGKHINIVNLLGACTKNVGKRELIVIVEYCRFGNIHNYMQKHREVFIDQFSDNKEKNLGKINRAYSCSSASSGMHSDYFGSNHTQATDHTFLNTANTTKSGRKVSEGYVQPEWRSNYESDYQSLVPRPLFSRDLLAWAFQIARGMEYLASRKVLHGDLAARNVLLADDNVVKICDFGLARSIYKNDEYQKKENSPLPVKWLAIECMTDRIFSTQSDVWSFGIVLWELFSLAKTPYPNMSPQSLLQYLTDGHRLEKPPYADDRLYDVMMRCWEQKPTLRPTFTQLQETLGSFLEDNVRNHYVDLNSSCMDMNAKNEGQEDYLAMMSAPDYNNLVTPSPHHYVNEVRSFFPPSPNHIPHDEEGYLQMTPAKSAFSPMSQNAKFDFDARKMNTRSSEASNCGSELTPMLTLNNLPARSGSESDHEGNHSPYLNMCPRIEEESDEVFETKANNIKNVQNSAVTNPTYITFDVDVEKKSQDINNTYINMPNGLVK